MNVQTDGVVDLRHHGDDETAPGLVDLAVNVRAAPPPRWLREVLAGALGDLAAYPDQTAARAAVAARHRRPVGEVLLTSGAAEAFVLLARAVPAARPVVVHPQFTEPEAALLAAGRDPRRHVLAPPFVLDLGAVPADSDLVVVGNPTNPTSVLHPAGVLAELTRPGRTVVVDEAFADSVAGEPESLAARRDLPGRVVVRSLTKTWGLAGLRCGYLLAAPDVVARLAAAQPLWPVSTPALAAMAVCVGQRATAEAAAWARELRADRAYLQQLLAGIEGVDVVPGAAASVLLLHVNDGLRVHAGLRARGYALRRGDTFPGLGSDWLRVAVRDRATTNDFVHTLAEVLS